MINTTTRCSMEKYLAGRNRATRFTKMRERCFEVFISNLDRFREISVLFFLAVIVIGLIIGIAEQK